LQTSIHTRRSAPPRHDWLFPFAPFDCQDGQVATILPPCFGAATCHHFPRLYVSTSVGGDKATTCHALLGVDLLTLIRWGKSGDKSSHSKGWGKSGATETTGRSFSQWKVDSASTTELRLEFHKPLVEEDL
jgi:hypothetical protein